MASIKEAFDSTMKEAFTGIKIFLWAIPLAYALTPLFRPNSGSMMITSVACVLYFFLLGFVITLAHNVISKESTVVPGINFIVMAKNALLGLIAIIPYSLLSWLIEWGYSHVTLPNLNWDITFKIIVHLFAVSLPVTALCILVRRMNIVEVFNIKKYLSGVWTTFLDFAFFGIRAGLVMGVVVGLFIYLFALFIGFDNTFWIYIMSLITMFAIVMYSNAIAQISDDIYTFAEKEEQKRRDEAHINSILEEQSKIKDMR